MPALEEVIHGIEHPRRTTAVAMRLVKHRIIVNFAHQAVRTGQGPLNGRTHLLRFPDIEQIRTRMRIAERNNRLVEEHELQNNRRTIAQHHIRLIHCSCIKSISQKGSI